MKKLIIAEKPGVGMIIKNSIYEKFERFDGYFESDNYIVSFAYGHLLEAWTIEDYLGKNEKSPWTLEDLPHIPTQFKYKLIKDSDENIKKNKVDGIKKQYEILKTLINRDDVTEIINSGDSDREGQVIIDELILETLKNKSKTIKRLWLPEQTEESIKKALIDAPLNRNYENLYNEGILRGIQDNLLGIQLTRYTTLLAKKKLPVGRVLTVIVKTIYDRDKEIKNFISQQFYNIKGVSADKSINYTVLKTDKDSPLSTQKSEAESIIKSLYKEAAVISIDEKDIVKSPKKLFSLDTLQNKFSKEYKIKPTDTLKILQELYQKGYTTYPRTNTEYLSTEEIPKVENLLNLLKGEHKIEINNKKTIFDNSKIESHSALIITSKFPKNGELSENENLVYTTIKNRFISNFLVSKAIITETVISLEVAKDIVVTIKGKSIKEKGYLEYENDIKDTTLPRFEVGSKIDVSYSLDLAKTSPKAHLDHTDLSKFLKNPFKKETDSEDEIYKNILDGLEIGTVATRGAIIDNTVHYGYVEFKNDRYTITELGVKYIDLLDKLGINLYKERTVEFSKMLKKVYKGEATVQQGIDQVKELLNQYIRKDVSVETMADEKEIIGKCPRCSKNIYEGLKSFYCEGYKDQQKCEFVLWKENKFFSDKGKKLTKTLAVKFLKDKIVTVKGFKKKDGKGDYNAKVEMSDTIFKEKLYVNFKILEFTN